jgi:hypothetical protein
MYNINQRFEFLNKLTKMVIDGITPSIILVGEGGLGKTHSVLSAINERRLEEFEYVVIKGYSTARGLYNTLYDNRNRLIIFDDCDSILEDKVAVNVLKSALDSYDKRKISWLAKMNKSDECPQSFNFTGGIIFISNKNKKSIDDAIISRSLIVDLSMTNDEKIDRMKFIVNDILPEYSLEIKTDALNFLESKKNDVNLNLRSLILTSKLRMTHPDSWRDLSNYMITTK